MSMTREEIKSAKYAAVLVAVIFALAIGFKLIGSYFEASAYNRATGSNVSTWDAMWIELRVQAGPKSE
jgi:hypothetical protein